MPERPNIRLIFGKINHIKNCYPSDLSFKPRSQNLKPVKLNYNQNKSVYLVAVLNLRNGSLPQHYNKKPLPKGVKC